MSVAEPHNDAMLGRVIGGKFEIESLIGRGGMGAVYRARQKNLKRAVAIKVLRPELVADASYAARFKREANAASLLDHPNLMRVYDFGEDDGLLYIAMELVDGKSLLGIMREDGALPRPRVIDLGSQLLAALAVMHDEGVIHRDLKPENVMVVRGKDDDGRPVEIVKVCDFGIAKQVVQQDGGVTGITHTATLTATGALVGTPEYMSPEQARGDGTLDARSDLYSFGVILYQLVTGKLPFKSSNSMKVLLAHLNEPPIPPSQHVRDLDPRIEEIILRALEKSPENRFADAREMRAALREASGLRDSSLSTGHRAATVARPSLPPPAQGSAPPVAVVDPTPKPTPSVRTHDSSVETRRQSEVEIAAAVKASSSSPAPPTSSPAAASSSSGIVARGSGTLASGAAVSIPPPAPLPSETRPSKKPGAATEPTEPPTHSAPSSVPPPNAPPRTETSPPKSAAVPLLLTVVVVLLLVIAVLLARK